MSGIFLQMIGDEWLGIETGWEEVKSKELFLQLLMLANLNQGDVMFQPLKVATTEEMLADLGINPALLREVMAHRKKIIGRRGEEEEDQENDPAPAGEMSAKLKEQLDRLTMNSEPTYNEFGDIGDVTLQHQFDLSSLAAMVADQKLDPDKIRVLTLVDVHVTEEVLKTIVTLLSSVACIVIKSMSASEEDWESITVALRFSDPKLVDIVRLVGTPHIQVQLSLPAVVLVRRVELTKLELSSSVWVAFDQALQSEDSLLKEVSLLDIVIKDDTLKPMADCLAKVEELELSNLELEESGSRMWEEMVKQEGKSTRRVRLSLMTVYDEQIRHLAEFLAGIEQVSTFQKLSNPKVKVSGGAFLL